MALKGKPMLIATGACNIGEVKKPSMLFWRLNKDLVLMQCNTNYTASLENFKYINLNVLKTMPPLFRK
jgi:N-acetylneuraminate synthase